MTRTPERIINQQVLAWSQQQAIVERGGRKPLYWPVFTISREFGAQGTALAAVLASRTGFPVWDKELVAAVAEESGADERILRTLDERAQRMIADAVLGAMTGRYTNLQYLRTLMHVVHTIAAHGSSIIVGRGANYICKPSQALRVRLVCPLKQRIRGYAEREGISLGQARRVVLQRDSEREEFIRRNFKHDVAMPADYDLVLNSGSYDLDQLADVVLAAYEIKVGRRPQEVFSVAHR
jgi:cytidylate kinase